MLEGSFVCVRIGVQSFPGSRACNKESSRAAPTSGGASCIVYRGLRTGQVLSGKIAAATQDLDQAHHRIVRMVARAQGCQDTAAAAVASSSQEVSVAAGEIDELLRSLI